MKFHTTWTLWRKDPFSAIQDKDEEFNYLTQKGIDSLLICYFRTIPGLQSSENDNCQPLSILKKF